MKKQKKLGATVRLSLLSSCQSGCDFCHLEGFKKTDEIGTLNPAIVQWKKTKVFDNLATQADIDRAIKIASVLNIKNVNLTGGEPTLFPGLLELITQLDAEGLSTSITTHAELPPKHFAQYLSSDVDWIVVAMHAIEPSDYVEMDLVAQDISRKHGTEKATKYALRRLENKKANVLAAIEAQRQGFIDGVLTNTVITSVSRVKAIIEYCNEIGLMPRVQRDLNNKARSQVLLNSLIEELGAKCVGIQEAIGDSSGSGIDYSYASFLTKKVNYFRVKEFGDVYVPTMCNNCSLRKTDSCRERFYGVRVEKGRIRTCIDRDIEGNTCFDAESFINLVQEPNSVPNAIAKQYVEAMNIIEQDPNGEIDQ